MPEWSSYAYTFNNPVNFTDPTGMIGEGVNGPDDIIIWYKDENGKDASFRFTGYNFHDSPDNDFVDAVLGAIFYNISNGKRIIHSVKVKNEISTEITEKY